MGLIKTESPSEQQNFKAPEGAHGHSQKKLNWILNVSFEDLLRKI
uniref:Uncharacterized protein n=1 Tax=Anguilla anguilla TaxID=7936 RepID=A0A0E9R2B9_ANGAN